jgi:hypothetical protein
MPLPRGIIMPPISLAEEAGYIAGLDKLPCEVPEEYAATAADWLVGYDAGRHRSLEADEKLASVGLQ